MFDLVNGLPFHPLVVHAVVVLIPLALVGTIAVVAVPTWRRPYGPVTAGLLLASMVLTPVATSSGEALEHRVGRPGADHAELGEQLIWFELVLLIALVGFLWLDRRRAETKRQILAAVGVVAVLAAVASGVQVYRVGDSGAKAAWAEKVAESESARP